MHRWFPRGMILGFVGVWPLAAATPPNVLLITIEVERVRLLKTPNSKPAT